MSKHIDIVFDGPPGPEAGRFVEVENAERQSINTGAWIQRDDGYWALRLSLHETARLQGINEAIALIEPKEAQPCDCIKLIDDKWWGHYCDCRNGGDTDRAQSWCESKNNATTIRVLLWDGKADRPEASAEQPKAASELP